VTQPLVRLSPSPASVILPAAVAVVLIGLFTLVTRRRAVSQVVGFLVLDNGITATAFLAAAGVPLIVELGISFDLLLVVLVLQVLTTRLRAAFGDGDLDELRELHD
jgi:hydrogenase-4 component E